MPDITGQQSHVTWQDLCFQFHSIWHRNNQSHGPHLQIRINKNNWSNSFFNYASIDFVNKSVIESYVTQQHIYPCHQTCWGIPRRPEGRTGGVHKKKRTCMLTYFKITTFYRIPRVLDENNVQCPFQLWICSRYW